MARKRTTGTFKPDDPRTYRSLEALSEAFLQLVEQKPLDEIAIKDITDAAGLSYPTFFRRFRSKQELLEHIAADEVRKLLGLSRGAWNQTSPTSKRLCEYVQEHRRLWKALLTGGAASAMRLEFMRIAKEMATGGGRRRVNPWLPLDLAVPFVTSGIFEILSWWLLQPEDYPVENVCTILDVLVIKASVHPHKVKLKKAPALARAPRLRAQVGRAQSPDVR